MERIYHRYELWEDYRYGLYDNCNEKELLKEKVVELFSRPKLTQKYMLLAIKKWRFSCEHNLSNQSLNRVAYLGQAACCLYGGVPAKITMEAWWLVPEKYRNIADQTAKNIIEAYCLNLNNRQLCLKFI